MAPKCTQVKLTKTVPFLLTWSTNATTDAPMPTTSTTTHRLDALREGLHAAWRQRGGRVATTTTTPTVRPPTTTSSAATHATPPSTHRRPATTAPAATRRRPHVPSAAVGGNSERHGGTLATDTGARAVEGVGGAVQTPTLTGGGRARRGGRRARTLRRGRGAWGTRRGGGRARRLAALERRVGGWVGR